MVNNYFSATAKDFISSLDEAGAELNKFSRKITKKSDDAYKIVNDFSAACEKHLVRDDKSEDAINKSLNKFLDTLREAIKLWQYNVEKDKQGRKFMHDHEKHMVVMVFGAVKAGKSTLGNFFAGREWLAAPFDNVYKHLEPTDFATQEKGRNTGDIVNVDGRTWFCEGVTDTTGDIQYFTLSGLRWFDTPGTGALSRIGDARNMEEMVNEYIEYADLCIFLVNSSEPGLMEDMKYLQKLSDKDQEALVVITRSDDVEEEYDEATGDLKKTFVAKSPERRKNQEDDMLKRLGEAYPEIDKTRYKAMSISALLGKIALKNGNEKVYRQSNLDELMKRLTEKARKGVVERKEKRPKQALNNFIKTLIEGNDEIKGLNALKNEFIPIKRDIKNFKDKISSRAEKIAKNITRKARVEVETRISMLSSKVMNQGGEVSVKEISDTVFNIVNPMLAADTASEVTHVIGNSQLLSHKFYEKLGDVEFQGPSLSQQMSQLEYEYTVTVVDERDPRGFWEHCRSFFGKKYYESDRVVKKGYITSVTGTNVEQVLDYLLPQVEGYCKKEVEKALTNLVKTYYLPQEKYIEAMEREISLAKNKLTKLIM
ncbi:MAG: 50S ribosome-binding GTPase [Lachnospiraceae bacterium]|nr:50S ribosome-binding GTPase [Lachnospiraceae bacterium]